MLKIGEMDENELQETLEAGEPTTTEFLGANISEGFDNTTTGIALESVRETFAGGSDQRASKAQAQENIRAFYDKREPNIVDPESPQLKTFTGEDWAKSDYKRDGIKWQDGWSEGRAKFMAESYDKRKEREEIIAKGNPDGMLSVKGGIGFVGQMIGGLPDPINLLSLAAPGTGIAAKVGAAALEGAAGNVAVSAFTRPFYKDRGVDWTWGDFASDVFVGGALGGAFGGAGHLLDTAKARRSGVELKDKAIKAEAADLSIKQTLEGEPVNPSQIEGFNEAVNKTYSLPDAERQDLIQYHSERLSRDSGLAPEEARIASVTHVANAVVMSNNLRSSGIDPSMTAEKFLDSDYGVEFQRAEMGADGIERINPNTDRMNQLLDDEINIMLSEVDQAVVNVALVDTVDGAKNRTYDNTFPEWYRESGAKNKEDLRKVVETKSGKRYDRLKQIAEKRLMDGYENQASGRVEPYQEFIDLRDPVSAEIPVGPDGSPLFKKSQGTYRGAIVFRENQKAMLSLFGAKNETTIHHETAHLFLNNYQRVAENPNAPRGMLDDLDTLKSWAATQADDPKLSAADNLQEKVARGYEQYLREGKAPVPELQAFFDRMKDWFMAVYKNAADLKIEITPEVRAVYDRMLSLEPRPDTGPVKPIDLPPTRTPEQFESAVLNTTDETLVNHPMLSPEEREGYAAILKSFSDEEQVINASLKDDGSALYQSAENAPDGLPENASQELIDAFNKKLEAQEVARQRLIEIAVQKKELKRQAYINLEKREELLTKTKKLMSQGVDPKKAILSLLEGRSSLRGMEGAGNSLDARINAIGETTSAKTFSKLREIDPEIGKLFMDDPQFNESVILEMLNIGKGEPGISKDPMASKAAKIFSEMMEEIRQRANLAGATIGKLDGYIPRFHDYEKMIKKRAEWVAYVKENIDLEKSFKGLSGRDLEDAIDVTYENMTSGEWLTKEAGQFDPVKPLPNTPRNIATRMEAERSLHFKTPEAELKYLNEFGQGRNVLGMMVKHIQNNSRKIGIMESMGTQPEANLASLYSTLRQDLRINEGKIDGEARDKMLDDLNFMSVKNREDEVGKAFMLAMGEGTSFAYPRLKYFGSMVRLFNSVSKLGAATLSQFTDFAQIKNEARLVTGNNQASAWVDVMQNYLSKISPEVRTQVLDHIATLGDGMNYANFNRFDQDNVNNWIGRMSDKMFKWSGQNWHTNKGKSAMALIITKSLGKNMDKSFDQLPGNLKAMLTQYGSFNSQKWDMLKNVSPVEVDGVKYFHPGLVNKIDDAKFDAFIPEEFRADKRPAGDAVAWEKDRASHIRREKYRLETDLQTFFLEESRNGMLEPDARTRRLSTFGTKAGTIEGEAARLMMQFKSFSIAYTDRVLGGKRFSDDGSGEWGKALAGDPSGAIQHVVASLGLAYMSMVAKDLSKGLEPKDPTLGKTWLQAGFQSGGLGIMGDFMQAGISSRSASDALPTLMGPTFSTAGSILNIGGRTLREGAKGSEGDFSGLAEDYTAFARSNMPFGSLWYTRAAVNYLVWDRLKESLEPGSIRRSQRRLKKEYNQKSLSAKSFGF